MLSVVAVLHARYKSLGIQPELRSRLDIQACTNKDPQIPSILTLL